ncbi:hypothetical protein [Aeromonas veronii]|uniref:hypothetical protein n=1 Tax=Aeromonas veronii TaxID=654 RepID=UPI0032EEC19B
MRHFFPLLFIPSLSYAACAPGVNYGSLDLTSPSPVCIAYSGSTLGGCTAYCGGGAGSSVCVELPAATPPSKGPYFSDGTECELGGGGDNGGGDNGGGDNGGGDNGGGDNGGFPSWLPPTNPIQVGGAYQDATTAALRHVNDTLRGGMLKLTEQGAGMVAYANSMDVKMYDLLHTAKATNNGMGGIEEVLRQQQGVMWKTQDTLQQLTNCVVNPNGNNCEHLGGGNGGGGSSSGDTAAIKNMMQTAMGWWGGTPGNLSAINSQLTGISNSVAPMFPMLEHFNKQQTNLQTQMAGDLAAIKDAIKDGAGSGGDGGVGDKPCTGPLCTFSPPSGAGGTGFSDIFGEVAIAGVKQQIVEKEKALKDKMQEVRSVFIADPLEISGTYNTDFHDIKGANIDLSGKSNFELFFSLGPKQALWFLAVLVAFAILMGGRKNA